MPSDKETWVFDARRPSRRSRAVVTGAGSGIGRAFALELARRGGSVVCADLDRASAAETVRRIEGEGGRATVVRCDVASADDVAMLAAAADAWFGGPTSLVINNAGIGTGGARVGETSLEDWRRTVDVNLWGVVHGCHVFVPRLRAAGRGGILNVASAAGFAAAPRMSAYNVTKAGVMALSETLAAELAGSGVRVTVLCPTFVATNIVSSGRITDRSARLASKLMAWVGASADAIATTALDAFDNGQLYAVPQIDARAIWHFKRALPTTYARALGVLERAATGLAQGAS